MSGLMSVTGADAEHPVRVGVPIIDMVSGIYTALGVAAALVGRYRTGVGSEVSTSLLESALSLSTFHGQAFLSTGHVPVPQGNNHPLLSPYGVFATADVPIIIAVGTERQWQQLCTLLGVPELAEHPDFETGRLRSANRARLSRLLEEYLTAKPGSHWLHALREAKIPTGPIYTYEQAFADEQVQALDMVTTVHRADGSALPLVRGPLSIDGQSLPVRKAPPALGQDTGQVLESLGLTADQVRRLIEAGVVTEALQPAGETA
jgi:crotonobetainyl-CoA:carnitine CoA-transferase CaiB-like acyl-CoA transferase